MSGLIWIVALFIALLKPDWLQGATTRKSEAVRDDTFVARVVGYMPQRARWQLERAMPLAVRRLVRYPAAVSCSRRWGPMGVRN